MTNSDKLDPLSKEYIAYALRLVADDSAFFDLCMQAVKLIAEYSKLTPEQRIKRLEPKLIQGGLDHGAPIYTEEEVREEIWKELDDLIAGWPLIAMFNQDIGHGTQGA